MKRWLLPALAIGVTVFLMTEKGRELQESFSSNVGDWADGLLRLNEKAQEKLEQFQSTLEHFSRALSQAAKAS